MGGQALGAFDFGLAPYVHKSFKKALKSTIENWVYLNGLEKHEYFNIPDDIRYKQNPYKDNVNKILSILKKLQYDNADYADAEKIYNIACKSVEDETEQAMEALVHNFNSLVNMGAA